MSLLFKEGFVLACLPLVAFMTAYMFEIGYADAFAISHELIDVDLKIMVFSVVAVMFLIAPLVGYLYLMFSFGAKKSRHSRWLAMRMVMPMPLLLAFYISGFTSLFAFGVLIVAVIIQLFSFIKVAIKARKLGWDAALSAAADSEGIKERGSSSESSSPMTMWDRIQVVVMPLFLLFILLSIVRGVGVGSAHLKGAYSTFTMDGAKYVILAGYGDRFVLGGLAGGRFNGRTYVVPKNSDKLIDVKLEPFPDFLPSNFSIFRTKNVAD